MNIFARYDLYINELRECFFKGIRNIAKSLLDTSKLLPDDYVDSYFKTVDRRYLQFDATFKGTRPGYIYVFFSEVTIPDDVKQYKYDDLSFNMFNDFLRKKYFGITLEPSFILDIYKKEIEFYFYIKDKKVSEETMQQFLEDLSEIFKIKIDEKDCEVVKDGDDYIKAHIGPIYFKVG